MTIEQFQEKFGIIGRSPEIRDLIEVIMQVATSNITVLIYGESGVGKEVFARAIHGFSKRADSPLVSVNCGAIPEGILESELFGHKKGSFTGATETRKGYFELADNGTLFLDEIAEMPLTTQVKLLRAIETQEILRVGAETIIKVDVRFIAATNKDLQIEVDSKRFREDLYFRLKAVSLNIPPLRKRKIDIPELAIHFLNQFSLNNNTERFKLSPDAYDLLLNYSWPGNVRELKNTIETAASLSKSTTINADVFKPILIKEKPRPVSLNTPVYLRKSAEELDREFLYRALFELKKDILDIKNFLMDKMEEPKLLSNPEQESDFTIGDKVMSIREAEKLLIENALKKAKYNKSNAAKMLGITIRTLYRKIIEYNIE